MDINNILVIGAGTMGNGIAHVFAQTGYNVVLYDINDSAIKTGHSTIEKNLARLLKKGAITEEIVNSTLSRIKSEVKFL